MKKFEDECYKLKSACHPNIVQYLGTYLDPDTNLPVLLMELCDQNLTNFLIPTQPVPYHIQLNISHDIALAMVYLHQNGLVHRDLTSNNVLLIVGVRAKITDFGMCKLTGRSGMTTVCPGNRVYMPPEALKIPTSYTEKLDVFSFGVMLIQIMTREFPNPGPESRQINNIPNYPDGTVKVDIPEIERRDSHLQMIPPNMNELKAIAIRCLQDKEKDRPSSEELSFLLSELKQTPRYKESSNDLKRVENNQLKIQMEQEIDHLKAVLQEKTDAVCVSQEMIAEFQFMIEEKDKKIQQLTLSQAIGHHPQQEEARKGIDQMIWEERNKAPETMRRGAVVIYKNHVFMNCSVSLKVFQYTIQGQQWVRLPDKKFYRSSLAVINGILTTIGGQTERNVSKDTLLSLTGEDIRKQWSEIYPVMPTARSATVAVTTDQALIVAGGCNERNINTGSDEYQH